MWIYSKCWCIGKYKDAIVNEIKRKQNYNPIFIIFILQKMKALYIYLYNKYLYIYIYIYCLYSMGIMFYYFFFLDVFYFLASMSYLWQYNNYPLWVICGNPFLLVYLYFLFIFQMFYYGLIYNSITIWVVDL